MSWFKKFFGYRTQLAPSGSLPLDAVRSMALGFCYNVMASHGWSLHVETATNTNSMLPVIDSNSVMLTEGCPFESLSEGDIITFFGDPKIWGAGKVIMHRLNEKVKAGWRTLGDGNGRLDPEVITEANFHRRVVGIFYASKTAETDN